MSVGRTFRMPARREVLKRLATVNPSQHVAEYLHSEIANYSSKDLAAPGIVTMLMSEIETYGARFRDRTMVVSLTMLVPGYIRAQVRDRRVQAEALQIFKQVNS